MHTDIYVKCLVCLVVTKIGVNNFIKNPKNKTVRFKSRCSMRTDGRDGHDEASSHYSL